MTDSRSPSSSDGLASSLNPAAGRHAVTTDPRELAAVEAAGARSLAEYPYWQMRYGERARAFALSDGAWLVKIGEMNRREGVEQVKWLGRVLASRGMPQILLERYLELLQEELGAKTRYRVLADGQRALQRMRENAVPPRLAKPIIERFRLTDVPHFAELLVSAVADERNGIENAVPSIEGWATDTERFGRAWIEAVKRTVREARAVRRGKPQRHRGTELS